MIKTEITTDIGKVEEMLGSIEKKAPNVLRRAINRTVTNVKKNMAIEATRIYYVKSGDVKKTIKISYATRARLEGIVTSRAGAIPLYKFRVSPKRKVSYKNGRPSPKFYKAGVKKENGLKPLNHNPKAFIAVMKSGHAGVFERKSGKSVPIKQLYGPSVPQMIENDLVMIRIQNKANETLEKRIEVEINHLLERG